MQEYRGDLGIALSAVVGMTAFFRDFDRLFSKTCDSARHDSGDPSMWGERLVSYYQGFGIDPRAKFAVFSDGLDMPRALDLARHFRGRIRTSFGVGTSLTNDLGFSALNIVLKMTRCCGQPAAKLSDSDGKLMASDPVFTSCLRQTFQLPAPPPPVRPLGNPAARRPSRTLGIRPRVGGAAALAVTCAGSSMLPPLSRPVPWLPALFSSAYQRRPNFFRRWVWLGTSGKRLCLWLGTSGKRLRSVRAVFCKQDAPGGENPGKRAVPKIAYRCEYRVCTQNGLLLVTRNRPFCAVLRAGNAPCA